MGTWGHRSFENDQAMDWADTFVDAEEGMPSDDDDDDTLTKEGLLAGPLAMIANLPKDEYVEADLAWDAIAAAEVVAALFGKPGPEVSAARGDDALARIKEWVSTTKTPLKKGKDLLEVGRKALKRVTKSELSELWAESDDKGAAWKKEMEDLYKRLAG